MSQNAHLWMYNEEINLKTNIREVIRKIANISNHLFVLTECNNLYEGFVEIVEDCKCLELSLVENIKAIDIDTCKECVYIVTLQGTILVCNRDLSVLNKINVLEEFVCPHGHSDSEFKREVKIKKLAVSEYGKLFISEDNQLWGSGYMPHVDINSDSPKKISFFAGRTIHNISIGSDFAVVVVSKSSSDYEDLSETFVPNCLRCLPVSQKTSPDFSPTSESCPLGVKLKNISNDLNIVTNNVNQNGISVDSNQEELGYNLDKHSAPKNIIFRNTEAAKEFLTRQISRMSSVGEEYLIECTEKPTRMIKENVNNVATLVYEGVKTVSDKVATLSRHVSASSECNSNNDQHDQQSLGRRNSKEDFLLSVSQSTSEKDLSEVEIQERVDFILKKGSNLLNREVWTWGNIFHGLVGIEEKMKRELPVIISMLSNTGVCKISLQNHHACALTLDGRAFIWGQNNYHQVTMENNVDQISPKLYVCNYNENVKDVTCGADFTEILTSKSNVIYFGKGSECYQNLFNLLLSTKQAQLETKPAINLYENLLSTSNISLLSLEAKCDDYIANFLFKEQCMLEEMLCVHQYIIRPLLKKTSESENPVLYETLCKNYTDLMNFLAVNVHSVLEYKNCLISLDEVSLVCFFSEHISIYKHYVNVVQNVASINGFENIAKLVTISHNLYKLKSGVLKDKAVPEKDISLCFLSPVKRIGSYVEFFRRYCKTEFTQKWKDFTDYADTKAKEAERTNHFWSNSGKCIDHLKSPERRLICDSQSDPITLQNSSRFSSHRFVLFSDIFAHINGSTSFLHPLFLIWLELPHHDTFHLICLKMPETTLSLVASDGVFKNKWFHVLQQAINISLNKKDLHQPPLARNGSYTFLKSGFFKDATYTGRWLNGKMHGSGKMIWPDGRVYSGQFSNNILSGYGTMDIPGVGFYEGQWKDNKQNGYGTFTYSNKDVYRGYFKDGMPHGHGFLRTGSFTANCASFYIGEWKSGLKSGYGVMDDISTGEKYIGSWLDDQKHGNGLIVTSDGVYYEGNFSNGLLSGSGIMILEDGTYYEGEFKGTGLIGGKGFLTLPSGHCIEGILSGSIDKGIKISNGTINKPLENFPSFPKSFGKLCTPPSQKWTVLFSQCYQVLGLSENDLASMSETSKIWQNVAVYLSNASTMKRNKGDDHSLQNSLNNLDVIPPFGRDRLNFESYMEIKSYLNRAFDSNFHPLGSLLVNLCEAYIASYNGKIHPILVSHGILEIIDLTQRIYEIIRYLFPALPTCDNELLIENDGKEEIVSYQSLLYPIVLPKIYNCLSTLLTLKNENQEKQYKRALMEWNKLTDSSLMNLLSVHRKFFNVSTENNLLSNYEFTEAIENLQQIKSMFLPIEKLTVIRKTVEKMTPVAQTLLGDNYFWNMDDLFPLFLYVVVRARIPDLGAELEFIENFMDPSLENGELGIMFTTLKACYQQILQDKSFCF